MTDGWRTDERPENTRRIGDITLVSEQHKRTGDTAHLVTFADGHQIRVLPDGSSGQKRSRLVRTVLEAAKALRGTSADLMETYVVGGLARAGLTWQEVGDQRQTIEDWLAEWFENRSRFAGPGTLLADLADDGWEIVRAND